jgi:4-hydroxy-3-polyprenylbenzoate decarboxylase
VAGAQKEIVVGVSGASGASLAIGFLQSVLPLDEIARVHLVVSSSALAVARQEIGAEIHDSRSFVTVLGLEPRIAGKIEIHGNDDVSASISSGSYPTAGMVVVPCSAGTLASIAHGISRGLLQRAADVTLKERRPLVLSFRESPYSLIHLENMAAATRAGAIVMPPSPAFYIDAPSIERLMQAYYFRVARVFGLELPGDFVWKGPRRP